MGQTQPKNNLGAACVNNTYFATSSGIRLVFRCIRPVVIRWANCTQYLLSQYCCELWGEKAFNSRYAGKALTGSSKSDGEFLNAINGWRMALGCLGPDDHAHG